MAERAKAELLEAFAAARDRDRQAQMLADSMLQAAHRLRATVCPTAERAWADLSESHEKLTKLLGND